MQELLDLLMANKVYLAVAVLVGLGIMFFLIKKVFKLFLIIVAVAIAYAAFLYVSGEDPVQAAKDKFKSSKSTIDKLDDATRDIQKEALDKVIDEVDKKLKKTAGG